MFLNNNEKPQADPTPESKTPPPTHPTPTPQKPPTPAHPAPAPQKPPKRPIRLIKEDKIPPKK